MIDAKDTIKFTVLKTGKQTCGIPDKPWGCGNGFWEVIDGVKTLDFFEEYEVAVSEEDFCWWLDRDC